MFHFLRLFRQALPVVLCTGLAATALAVGQFNLRAPAGAQASSDRLFVKKGVSRAYRAITDTRRAPALSHASRPRLSGKASEANIFGCMIGNDSWGYYDKPVGIYSIDPNTGASSMTVPVQVIDEGNPCGTYAKGKFHASVTSDFFGTIFSITHVTVDMESGAVSTYEMTDLVYENVSVNMTYDQVNDVIYSINYGASTDDYNLCRFDPVANSYTVVGALDDHYWGICVDGNSNMYGINDMGEVVKIDTSTGKETGKVASTNFVPAMLQSCCWSPTDKRIYWAACNYGGSELIAIDPATGICETLCDFSDGEEFIGLYCTDPMANPKAPAECTDLKVDYAAGGATTATVSCVLPATTFDGSPLAAPVTFTLKVDGEVEHTTESLSPGGKFSRDIELSEGAHRIEAVCSNAEGAGPAATAVTFAGTDRPGAAIDLTATLNDYTSVELSWTGNAAGANGGYIDPSKVSYTVKRNGKPVVTDLTVTAWTDHVGETIDAYTYCIETAYAGEVCAVSEEVTVIGGRYIALPYVNDFTDADSFKLLAVADGNGDGNTWVYEEDRAAAAYNFSRTSAADDYLILPRVKMAADHMYEISFTGRSSSSSYPEKAEIVWGTEAKPSALNTVIKEKETLPDDFTTLSGIYRSQADGDGYFAIHCVSDADMSTMFVNKATITDLGHVDAPQAPTGFTATNVADHTVSLSLTLPSKTNSGAALTGISKVEILRDGKVVYQKENAVPGEQINTTDEAGFGFNTYTAVAYAGELRGVEAVVKVFAGTYTLPFSVEPDPDEYTLFTAEADPDGYDNEWYYDISANALKISTYGSKDTDRYIFTPVIELGTANLIDLSFDVCAGLQYDTEALEVTYGPTPDRATHKTISRIEFNNTEFAPRTLSFEIPEPGRYHIGFHAVSEARHTCLSVKNIKLENGALKLAPAPATDVVATAGANGALTSEIEFTVPTANLDGKPLGNSTVDVALHRADGSVASSVKGCAPGSRQKLTDAAASAGVNDYTIISENSYGPGGVATVSVWCGVDIPGNVGNLEAVATTDNLGAVLSWTAPEGSVHDGWIDPQGITYKVYQLYNGKDLVKVAQTNQTTCTVYPDGGVLDFYYYYVSASTEAGEGITSYIGIVVGRPATLPMRETASNCIITNMPWISGPLAGDVNWGVAGYIGSLDLTAGDGGMFVCSAALPYRQPGAARMQLPKLAFNGVNAPTLTFSMYHYQASGAGLNVSVTTDDDNFTTVKSITADAAAEGWKTYSVNLAAYKDAPWVAIVFDGILDNGSAYVIVDDIEVANLSEYDLAISSVRGKSVLEAGETSPYMVEVRNCGKQHASFELTMKAGDEVIGTVKRESQLPAGGTDIYRFEFTATADHMGQPVAMSFEILPDGWVDEIPDNNKAAFDVTVVQPERPVVTDLAIEQGPDGAQLSWSEPTLEAATVTDSFEDYESFSYEEIGGYTLVDGDGLTPCGILGVNHPNMGRPMAFQVWEPMAEGVDVTADYWAPRTGKKCLVAWTSLSSTEDPYNDDWLISPALQLSDQSQKLSFWANRPVGDFGPESFEVLYSTTGTDVDDFTSIKLETVASGGWKEYSYELPAGSRHFAIRYVSRNKFAMLFDDLTYTPASETGSLRVDGYNVYRNGSKIGSTAAGETSFTDSAPDAAAPYNVTVVYDRGESLMSNTVRLTSGINDAAANETISVSGRQGYITVSNARGRHITVTAPDGMTVAASGNHGDTAGFAVVPGLYLVSIEGLQPVKVAAY